MAATIRLSQQHSCSFDHLVGAGEQRGWHGYAERLGSINIDEQLEFRWLLDRNVRRFRALQNLVYKIRASALSDGTRGNCQLYFNEFSAPSTVG